MLQTGVEEPRRESIQTELRCQEGQDMSSEDKGKDIMNKSRKKCKARSSSASEKLTSGGKDTSSSDPG